MECRAVRWAMVAALSVSTAAQLFGHEPKASEDPSLSDAQVMAIASVSLHDDEYYGVDAARATELGLQLAAALRQGEPDPGGRGRAAASAEPSPVLAIGAPRVVPMARRDELPLLIATRVSGMRMWQVNWTQNARVIVVDLLDGTVASCRLISSHKRTKPLASMSGNPPDALSASAVSTGVEKYSGVLRDLGRNWHPGSYALTVMNFDWISNTHIVELRGGASQPAAAARKVVPSNVTRSDHAPERGVQLRLPDRVAAGQVVAVHAAVNLPLHESVQVPAADQSNGHLLVGTLLLVGLDAESPLQIDLAIPVAPSDESGRVGVSFAFDLSAAQLSDLRPGTYRGYLFVGQHVSAPQKMSIE